jgi:hypothetical protein
MALLDRFKKRPAESLPAEEGLPEDLERFRLPPPEPPRPAVERAEPPARDTGEPFIPPEFREEAKPAAPQDRNIELVLSKLDTIDARLRYIEEKIRKL